VLRPACIVISRVSQMGNRCQRTDLRDKADEIPEKSARRTRVVIVGAGFGGLAAAKRLAGQAVDVTIVDQRNYHLFQPLLYQVATAALSPADVAWPIGSIFAKHRNIRVVLGKVEGVDLEKREVRSDRFVLNYDHLILATGSHHSYFGRDDWAMHAPGLKRIIDATEIRKRILLAFELAEVGMTEEERRRQLTFVIVGGGPTGVEMAGAIAELARFTLARDFRNIDPSSARVLLVEATDRLLRAFPQKLSGYAKRKLEQLGVEVLLDKRGEVRGEEGVLVGDTLIPSATVIWAAGVAVPRLKNWLPVEADRTGRIAVGPDLSLPGYPEVFVIGDAAAITWKDNLTVPGLAPAAKQRRALRRRRDWGSRAWQGQASAVPLSPPRQSRDNRPPRGDSRFWLRHADGWARLASLGYRARLLFDRRAGTHARRGAVVLGLFDLRTRCPTHHRSRSAL
jgi:NADH:ubiquinone reductase (H+-translocating)